MRDFKEIWEGIPSSWRWAFFICLAATLGLLVGGFVCPPPGVIDDSILKACFVISIYPTLFTAFICILRGLNVNYDIKGGKITVGSKARKKAEAVAETEGNIAE